MSRFRLQSVLLSESFCADKESASEHEFAGDVGLFFLAAMLSGSGFVRKLRTAFSKGKDRRFIRKRVSCHFTAAHAVFTVWQEATQRDTDKKMTDECLRNLPRRLSWVETAGEVTCFNCIKSRCIRTFKMFFVNSYRTINISNYLHWNVHPRNNEKKWSFAEKSQCITSSWNPAFSIQY